MCAFGQGNTDKASKLQLFNAQNPRGQLVYSAYRMEGAGSGGVWQVEAYSYDNKGRVTKKAIFTDTFSGGSVAPDLHLAYQYNLLGEVTGVDKKVGTETYYERFQYDVQGKVLRTYASHQYPDTDVMQYEEDEDGNFIATGTIPVTQPQYLKLSTEYTPLGQVKRQKFNRVGVGANSQEVYAMKYQYDILDRLTQINKLEYYASVEHFGAQYVYNAIGQITTARFQNPSTSNAPPWNQTGDHRYIVNYQYDALNRLLGNTHLIVNNNWAPNGQSTNKYKETLSYDANGNVLTLQRTNENGAMVDNLTMQYLEGSNRLTQVTDAAGANKLYGWDAGSSSNLYDLNGNLTSGDGANNVSYDVRNLPTTLEKNGKTIIYRYNAAGQRVYKKVIGTTITEEHYIMNGSELVAVVKSNGVLDYWKTSYGKYVKTNNIYTTYYYLTDHLGSTRVVLREDGVRTEAYDYYAFGLLLPGRTFGSGTKERFTGKERDAETGWDYFGARYYNPTIARWMNVDPLSDKFPSWSPYNYVMNNPLMMIDPNGKMSEWARQNSNLVLSGSRNTWWNNEVGTTSGINGIAGGEGNTTTGANSENSGTTGQSANASIGANNASSTEPDDIIIYAYDIVTGNRVPILIIKTALVNVEASVPIPVTSSEPTQYLDLSTFDNLQEVDGFMLNGGISFAAGMGLGIGVQAVIIFEGPDPGIHVYGPPKTAPINNYILGVGGGAQFSGGIVMFDESQSEMNRYSFEGWSYTISASTPWGGTDYVRSYAQGSCLSNCGTPLYWALMASAPGDLGLTFTAGISKHYFSIPFKK